MTAPRQVQLIVALPKRHVLEQLLFVPAEFLRARWRRWMDSRKRARRQDGGPYQMSRDWLDNQPQTKGEPS